MAAFRVVHSIGLWLVASAVWAQAQHSPALLDRFPPELVDFVAEPEEPVFRGAGAGHWDQHIRERGWILREDGQYRMWYTGYDDVQRVMKLGYATSPDGVTWTRYEQNPIYDAHWVEDMMVVRHGGTYYMFAEGERDRAQLLTSPDGIRWTRVGQLDVRRTSGQPIEEGPYGTPTAWFEDGVWYLFYERRDLGIWLATSRDLKVWTNVQDEPVIPLGPGEYDREQVALNQIIKYQGRYYAYYHGAGPPQNGRRLWCTCVATSTDLVRWEKYPRNPLFPVEQNKSSGILVPDGQQYLLYTMHPQVRRHVPRLATAASVQSPQNRSGPPGKTVLGVAGTQFTLNGRPTFLLGISYYAGLGAPAEVLRRDLDEIQKYGFNWIRVWATWAAFGHDVSAVDAEGGPRQPYLERLQHLVAECDRRGIVVDVTLSRGNGVTGPARLQTLQAHRRAVETLITALAGHRNWYLDLANERSIRDRRFVSFEELRELRDVARRRAPQLLVTASHAGGDLTRDEVRGYLEIAGVDFLAPHRPRRAGSAEQTAAVTRQILAWCRELGRQVPVHYQEPFRRGYGNWQPTADDFLADLQGARAGGAAGWCFHNGDTRSAPDGQPRRSFDLREKSLFEQLDAEEQKVLRRLTSPPPAPLPEQSQGMTPRSPGTRLVSTRVSASAPPAFAPPFEWQTTTPESQGLSSDNLQALAQEMQARKTNALLIVRNDKIVYEWYAPGHDADRRQGTASLAKALIGGLSLAVALTDGKLRLDDPASRGRDGRPDPRFAGGLAVFDAPEPWGPWTTVYDTDRWDVGPGDTASFPTKWMQPDGRTLYLVFSGEDSFSVRRATLQLTTSEPSAAEASPTDAFLVASTAREQAAGQAPSSARGPLRVHPDNPRYFTDGTRRPDGTFTAVYLTGSHTWNNLVEMPRQGTAGPPLDFEAYLDFLERHGHNFIRLWAWDSTIWDTRANGRQAEQPGIHEVAPHPWRRTGPGQALDGKPRFDLTQFDPAYFERLRSRVEAAGRRGIYVSVMLFEGWGLFHANRGRAAPAGWAWRSHPFHPSNNINNLTIPTDPAGLTGKVHVLGNDAVNNLQAAYIRKVVDTVNDLDNVLYEVINEGGDKEWDWWVVRTIQEYERTRPKQHPVGLTGHGAERVASMLASPADWVSPGRNDGYGEDPPAWHEQKPSLLDTDHIWGVGGNAAWVWKSFTRGHNPLFMDPYRHELLGRGDPAQWDGLRQALGQTRRLALRLNLAAMAPDNELASTGYCLAQPGQAYVIYLPQGGEVTVDLQRAGGTFAAEWMHPRDGTTTPGEAVRGGQRRVLKAPRPGDAVLYLRRAD